MAVTELQKYLLLSLSFNQKIVFDLKGVNKNIQYTSEQNRRKKGLTELLKKNRGRHISILIILVLSFTTLIKQNLHTSDSLYLL